MALWDGLILEQILIELMLEKLLGRYLMITVLNDSSPKHTVQKCKKVHIQITSIKSCQNLEIFIVRLTFIHIKDCRLFSNILVYGAGHDIVSTSATELQQTSSTSCWHDIQGQQWSQQHSVMYKKLFSTKCTILFAVNYSIFAVLKKKMYNSKVELDWRC